MRDVFLYCYLPHTLRQSLSPNLDHYFGYRLSRERSRSASLHPSTLGLEAHVAMPGLYVGVGDSNSSPHPVQMQCFPASHLPSTPTQGTALKVTNMPKSVRRLLQGQNNYDLRIFQSILSPPPKKCTFCEMLQKILNCLQFKWWFIFF